MLTQKIFSYAISKKFKPVSPTLTEISHWLILKGGFLVTMDIEKAFDSLDYDFFSSVVGKIGFGKSFITWI